MIVDAALRVLAIPIVLRDLAHYHLFHACSIHRLSHFGIRCSWRALQGDQFSKVLVVRAPHLGQTALYGSSRRQDRMRKHTPAFESRRCSRLATIACAICVMSRRSGHRCDFFLLLSLLRPNVPSSNHSMFQG